MRTWLITGVSSGFGFEMTKQLLEKAKKSSAQSETQKTFRNLSRNTLKISTAKF